MLDNVGLLLRPWGACSVLCLLPWSGLSPLDPVPHPPAVLGTCEVLSKCLLTKGQKEQDIGAPGVAVGRDTGSPAPPLAAHYFGLSAFPLLSMSKGW